MLSMCRSLGDKHAGERVLAEPEVSQILLDNRGARIILASDGLWDVLTGKNAAHRVRTVACSKAAARLRSVAKDQRDRADITVIVLDALDDPNARIPGAITESVGAPGHQVRKPTTGPFTASLCCGAHLYVCCVISTLVWCAAVASPHM